MREVLDTGKPEFFLIERPTKYLFVRPDIIMTEQGFRICEIETSPFGLALAEVLNKAYHEEGFETLVVQDALPKFVRGVYSDRWKKKRFSRLYGIRDSKGI